VLFLTEEWLDFRLRMLLGVTIAPGIDLSIQHVVTGGSGGPVSYYDRIEDGRLAGCALGVAGDADFTLVRDWADELYTAVVGGRIKVLGDEVQLLMLLPLLQEHSDELEMVMREIAAATESPVGPAAVPAANGHPAVLAATTDGPEPALRPALRAQ
jgi:hypothetical protein